MYFLWDAVDGPYLFGSPLVHLLLSRRGAAGWGTEILLISHIAGSLGFELFSFDGQRPCFLSRARHIEMGVEGQLDLMAVYLLSLGERP
jgi:hypothetical protein